MTAARVASARQVFFANRSVPIAQQADLERAFFKSLSLANGTHKTTAPARLKDVDQVLARHAKKGEVIRLLDVGISSGITTLELLDALEEGGIRVTGTGVDICTRGVFLSLLGIDILLDPAGNLLQIATPFFTRGRPHHTQKSFKSKMLRFVMDWIDASGVGAWILRSRCARELPLVSPRLLSRPNFSVVERDISLPMPAWNESFDVIRAANILNLEYFSPSQLAIMLRNISSWLKSDGIIAVCRTDPLDGRNDGSFYRKRARYLDEVHRLGRGSEVNALINERFCKNIRQS